VSPPPPIRSGSQSDQARGSAIYRKLVFRPLIFEILEKRPLAIWSQGLSWKGSAQTVLGFHDSGMTVSTTGRRSWLAHQKNGPSTKLGLEGYSKKLNLGSGPWRLQSALRRFSPALLSGPKKGPPPVSSGPKLRHEVPQRYTGTLRHWFNKSKRLLVPTVQPIPNTIPTARPIAHKRTTTMSA